MPVTPPTRTDAILAAATFCLVAAAAATAHSTPARALLAYCFALGFAVVILFGRGRPVVALLATAAGILVYYALDLPPVGLAAPIAAVLYSAAERGRVVPAAIVGGGLLAVSIPVRLFEGDDPAVVVGFDLGSEAALMVAVIALGDAVRNRRTLRAEMTRQAAAAEEERRREAARQVEAERLRIAREVHDTLGHTMSVITLQSAVAEEALTDGRPEPAKAALAAIHSAGGSAMAELRATLRTLRRDAGSREPTPGFDQLPALLDGVRRSGPEVDLSITGDVDGLPVVVGATVYRVAQEALTNVLRHALATRVAVTISVAAGQLSLEVVDDGRGMPADSQAGKEGQGLRGMSERVALLGGTVETGPADSGSGGFRVRVRLPLTRGEA